jgi:hypothetical protein
VTVPVLNVVSDGDRLNCHPRCGERFLALCGGPTTLERVRRSDDGSAPPGHTDLVTTERAKGAWARVEAWMRAAVNRDPSTSGG